MMNLSEYETGANQFKVIGEPIRLQILDILSSGEMCACDILQNLPISQPTLSHHMKALSAAGWVTARKKSTWMYYALNIDAVDKMHQYLLLLTTKKANASSRNIRGRCACCEQDENKSCPPETKTIGD